MSKIYLFGPMRGIPQRNEPAFAEARIKLRDMKHDVFCPSEFSIITGITDTSGDAIREAMRWDLAYILKEAEILVGLPGWRQSRECLAEVHLAWTLDLPVYEYEFFRRRVLRQVKFRALAE